MTHLLDSSAWLAHLFGESGVEQVNRLFDDPQNAVHISVLSIPEVYSRLKSQGMQDHWPDVWNAYSDLFAKVIPIDKPIAHRAILLRTAATKRLPTMDGLIAATAAIHECILVHRDPHFTSIPADKLRQYLLLGR